jgi:uncharacterized RmlC-like cupin family protein
MTTARQVWRIRPSERGVGAATPGMTREEAISTDRMWSGLARTEPGMRSGWHHHGDYETAIYVLSGAFRMEFGPGGTERIDAEPGDFLYVAKGAIHRESNPADEEGTAIVVRSGTGDPVFNVDGPDG